MSDEIRHHQPESVLNFAWQPSTWFAANPVTRPMWSLFALQIINSRLLIRPLINWRARSSSSKSSKANALSSLSPRSSFPSKLFHRRWFGEKSFVCGARTRLSIVIEIFALDRLPCGLRRSCGETSCTKLRRRKFRISPYQQPRCLKLRNLIFNATSMSRPRRAANKSFVNWE